ncbi:hypothetical protein F-M6_0003 [Faustovirus]|nr:hypothetical protein F-M6_0003 [Faustovirus]
MQDVIDNHLIRLSPVEFLDVSRQTREVAIEWIHTVRVSCDTYLYYKIINNLIKHKKIYEIRLFIDENYSIAAFKLILVKLDNFKNVNYALGTIIRYIPCCGDSISRSMLYALLDKIGWRWFISIIGNLGYNFVNNCSIIRELVELLLKDIELTDEDYWETEDGIITIKFTIKYFPDIIEEYIRWFVDNDIIDYNFINVTCTKNIIRLSDNLIDRDILSEAKLRLCSLRAKCIYDEVISNLRDRSVCICDSEQAIFEQQRLRMLGVDMYSRQYNEIMCLMCDIQMFHEYTGTIRERAREVEKRRLQ